MAFWPSRKSCALPKDPVSPILPFLQLEQVRPEPCLNWEQLQGVLRPTKNLA